MNDEEFHGKPYYPAMFFWEHVTRDRKKVEQVCRVLNALTKEQREAVEYFVEDRRTEDEWHANRNDL